MTRMMRNTASRLARMEKRTGRLNAAALAISGLGMAIMFLLLLATAATVIPSVRGDGGGDRVTALPPTPTTTQPQTGSLPPAPPADPVAGGDTPGLRTVSAPSGEQVSSLPARTNPDSGSSKSPTQSTSPPTRTTSPAPTTRPLLQSGVNAGPVQACAEVFPIRVRTDPCT